MNLHLGADTIYFYGTGAYYIYANFLYRRALPHGKAVRICKVHPHSVIQHVHGNSILLRSADVSLYCVHNYRVAWHKDNIREVKCYQGTCVVQLTNGLGYTVDMAHGLLLRYLFLSGNYEMTEDGVLDNDRFIPLTGGEAVSLEGRPWLFDERQQCFESLVDDSTYEPRPPFRPLHMCSISIAHYFGTWSDDMRYTVTDDAIEDTQWHARRLAVNLGLLPRSGRAGLPPELVRWIVATHYGTPRAM